VVALGSVLTAAALIFVALYLGHQNPDQTNKLTSILGTLLNILGVAIAAAGLILSWRMGRTAKTKGTRQVIHGDDTSSIIARRAQRATGVSGDIEQEIAGRGGSQIDASDAQSAGRDDE
jgi:hypothetical protein